jgi:hypothetical protein
MDPFDKSISIKKEYEKHTCSTFYMQMFDNDGNIKKDAGVELLNSLIIEKMEMIL